MKAYVLIETAAGKTKSVKKALLKIKSARATVAAMDAVTGPYDFIAVVEGTSLDAIGNLVTESIGAIEGVRMDAPHWLGVLATLWLGAIPFVLLGIVIGLIATPYGMQAITGLASMLFGLLGGIWIPADVAPAWLATIMKALPTYWVKQLTQAPFVSGVDVKQALFVITLWVAGLSLIAVRRYRAQS